MEKLTDSSKYISVILSDTDGQALTGTRYPTLPGYYFYYPYPTQNFFKISGFRVVTIHAVSTQDYINDASYLAPEGRDSLS